MYYLFILFATVLFSGQLVFQQQYQKKCGSSLDTALLFSIFVNGFSFIIMLVLNRFQMQFTWFSLAIALIYASVTISFVLCGIKALETANLSVYSMFAMLGGMLIPALFGILFFSEGITIFKVLCCILIVFSLALTIESKKSGGTKYYILVFILNGMVGVLAKIHQSSAFETVNSQAFMILANLIAVVLGSSIYIMMKKALPTIRMQALPYTAGFALFTGIGNLIALITVQYIPASVQYPLITGGVIVFSTAFSLFRREKIGRRNLIAAGIALLSTILVML